ncbi:hypothetical protein SUGI_0082410 [Cryptomeria japonica]|uniref:flowering time control protein FCA isoform X2 n=1 Tax=Cryptomeria japonica TaxID=3369 RepID=UPI002408EDF7|nr:flowering time control protein FCA isoform X2 [Cryptomeria japonica]GLJ08157.1 hypothetical protein SUGI_0082410 [Cryptomeria japonica]
MEASAHMISNNGRFPVSQSPMRQQQSGPPAMQNNSNNFINSKHFGGGGRGGAMVPRPGYGAHGIGHKRDSSGFDVGQRGSQASADGGAFVKLFVGHLPRTATEEDIRQLFAQHGNVLEVSMVRDQRVGQQHGCCFIKYATVLEAERAISAFHNRHTLPGGTSPLQVRFADGEREQIGTMEHKLFVGSLNKLATEKDIEEIFAEFGPVDDIYIMKDEQKQSRGCAFVKYPSREMAAAAINKLHGSFTMKGCNQPLTVRFAEPKRPKVGDARNGPMFGGPGFGAEAQRPFGSRPTVSGGGHTGGRGVPGNWRPMGVANMRIPSPQVGSHPYGRPSTPSGRSGSVGGHSPSGLHVMSGDNQVGSISGSQNSINGTIEGPVHVSAPVGGPARLTAPSPQQGYNSSSSQHQAQVQGWLPPVQQTHQMQQQLQPPYQNQHQSAQSHSQLQTSQQSLNLQQYGQHVQSSQLHNQQPTQSQLQMQAQQSLQQYGQQVQQPLQPHSQQPTQFHSQLQAQQSLQQYGQQLQSSQQHVQQAPFGHAPASQQQPSTYGQLPVSQSQIQPNVASSLQQIPPSMPLPSVHPQTQQQLSQQQPSSQILQQQVPAAQSNIQSQQHLSFQQQLQSPLVPPPLVQATTQSQQQPLLMRPQQQQPYYQVAPTQQAGLQQPWTFSAQPQGIVTTSSTSTLPMTAEAKSAAAVAPVSVPSPASLTCVWTEHTSPEGYKYYYNSVTGESKWEKPDELTKFEQQKQLQQTQPQPQPQLQQPHQQPQPQLLQPQQQQQPQLQQPNAQQQPQLQQAQQQHQPQLQQPQQLVQPSLSTSLNYGQLPGSNDTGSAPHQYMQQSLSAPQDWTWKSRPAGA